MSRSKLPSDQPWRVVPCEWKRQVRFQTPNGERAIDVDIYVDKCEYIADMIAAAANAAIACEALGYDGIKAIKALPAVLRGISALPIDRFINRNKDDTIDAAEFVDHAADFMKAMTDLNYTLKGARNEITKDDLRQLCNILRRRNMVDRAHRFANTQDYSLYNGLTHDEVVYVFQKTINNAHISMEYDKEQINILAGTSSLRSNSVNYVIIYFEDLVKRLEELAK